MTRTGRKENLLAAIFFVAATLVFLWPAIARFDEASYTSADLSQAFSLTSVGAPMRPGNAHLSDPVVEMLPWLEFNRSELSAGRLPAWNPSNGAGVPHLANAQSAVFSPFSLPFYFLALKQALLASAFLKLFALGMFTFLFLRALGMSTIAACAGGVIFEFGGHNVLLLAYPHSSSALALPAALWIIERAWQVVEASASSVSRRLVPWVCGLALVFAVSIFSGSPETAAFAIAAGALYALARAIAFARRHPTRARHALEALAWLLIASLLGFAIAAVQIWPFLEYASNSTLIEARQEGFDGLRKANWPLQFFPDLLGNPSQRYSPRPDLPYPNYEAANTSYFGPLTWLAAVAGAVIARRRFAGRFFAALAFVWILMAFDFDFLRPLMIAFTSLTHAPMNRSQFVPLLALAVLVGLAIDGLRPSEGTKRWFSFTSLCAAAALMCLAAHRGAAELVQVSFNGSPPPGQAIRVPPHMQFVTWTFALGSAVFASLALVRASWMRCVLISAFTALLFTQSGWLLRGFNSLSKDEHVFPRTAALETIAQKTQAGRLQIIGEDTLPPQTNMMYAVADIAVYDALNVGAYDKLYRGLFDSHGNWRETFHTTDHALKTLGVEFVLARDEWPHFNSGLPIDPDAPVQKPAPILLESRRALVQTFISAGRGLDRIYVALGAQDDPIPAFLEMTLEDAASGERIAARQLDTHSLRAGLSETAHTAFPRDLRFASPTAWVQLEFAARPDSAGHPYRLRLDAAAGQWKNGFIAWTVEESNPDRALAVGDAAQSGVRLCFDWSSNVSRDLESVATLQPFTLYRFKPSRGRFWTVHETRAAPDDESALAMTLAKDHDPYRTAIVQGAPALERGADAARVLDPLPVIVEESSRRVVLRANASHESWLVAALSWYPGWTARVEGRRVPLFRTNYAFLGLALPAGEHEVVLEFDSDTLRLGAWISSAALLVLAGLLAGRRWLG